ncbi:Hypothetical predicted protein [Cloeon dipterum]|uniref:Uncharacterized protein n=1 Tax=Cloeon dipterum TaxID=197152 RepID=A0A8S1C3N9_9INSE|nr:Hypothetical predicted protein [Cloeon dipterum]
MENSNQQHSIDRRTHENILTSMEDSLKAIKDLHLSDGNSSYSGSQQTFGGKIRSKNVWVSQKTYLPNLRTPSNNVANRSAHQRGQSTQMTFLDLQWCLNSRYKSTFDPIVCSQMIHLIRPTTSQDVAEQTVSFEEYNKLLPILDMWIAKFREFAFVEKDDGKHVKGDSIDFTTAIQQGLLNLVGLKQAFQSMNVDMTDNIADLFYQSYKEKKKEAVSFIGFISICLFITQEKQDLIPLIPKEPQQSECTQCESKSRYIRSDSSSFPEINVVFVPKWASCEWTSQHLVKKISQPKQCRF